MTKAELCKSISAKTGCDAQTVLAVVESLMVEVKESLEKGENVYLRCNNTMISSSAGSHFTLSHSLRCSHLASSCSMS